MGFYNEIEARVPNKSGFDRSYKNRLSMQFDYLYPTMVDETLPGDVFKVNQKNIARFAPMLAPAFADVKMYTHYFSVPRRIVEPFWREFISDDSNIKDDLHNKSFRIRLVNVAQCEQSVGTGIYVPMLKNVPSVDGTWCAKKSLCEYLTGISLGSGEGSLTETLDIAPFISYQYIFNEYYRDSQIDDDLFNVPYKGLWWLTQKGIESYIGMLTSAYTAQHSYESFVLSDGTMVSFDLMTDDLMKGILPITSVNWLKYSTSATTAIKDFANLNLQIIEDLFTLRKRRWYKDYFTCARTTIMDGEVPIVPVGFNQIEEYSRTQYIENGEVFSNGTGTATINTINNTSGDGSNASARMTKFGFTISALRLANALTKFGEKSVRFGLRYLEQIASHYGVIVSDKSIQIPQYCGGSQSEAYVNEVTQTSQSTEDSAQGNYSGHMMTANGGDSSKIYCEEHGYIFALTSCVAETAYGDGIKRMFQRSEDRLNFYFPEFANLTDQEVKLKELYFIKDTDGQTHSNSEVFGYQGRYDEYRTRYNEFHGEFKDNLDFWHLGRKFDHPSTLNWRLQVASYDHQDDGFPLTGCLYDSDQVYNDFFFDGVKNPPRDVNYLIWVPSNQFRAPELLTSENYQSLLNSAVRSKGNWAWAISEYNIFLGWIPFSWLTSTNEVINPNFYSAISSGLTFALLSELPDPDSLIPRLNSSFIESNVSTRLFAETKDLEYLNDDREYIIGDDYIMASFYNEIKCVRPMPISSEPKL